MVPFSKYRRLKFLLHEVKDIKSFTLKKIDRYLNFKIYKNIIFIKFLRRTGVCGSDFVLDFCDGGF